MTSSFPHIFIRQQTFTKPNSFASPLTQRNYISENKPSLGELNWANDVSLLGVQETSRNERQWVSETPILDPERKSWPLLVALSLGSFFPASFSGTVLVWRCKVSWSSHAMCQTSLEASDPLESRGHLMEMCYPSQFWVMTVLLSLYMFLVIKNHIWCMVFSKPWKPT